MKRQYPAAHVAHRAFLAGIAGRLRYVDRLAPAVLEQLRGMALCAAHGRQDERTDAVLRAALRILRDTDAALTRIARREAAERDARAAGSATANALPRHSAGSDSGSGGGTKVPLGPPPPRPLSPQQLRAEREALALEAGAL